MSQYKESEIGRIPFDWEAMKVGEFAKEISIRNKKQIEELPVLSVTKSVGIVLAKDYFKKNVHSKDTENYKLIKQGQFAYATIHLDEGSIGILDSREAGIISPMYTVFETDQNKVNNKYLLYLLKSPTYIKRYASLGQGSINRRMSVSFKTLSKFPIHFPPLKEQQKIAEILSSVDEAIEKTEAIIKQTETIKKGLMQQLLTKGIGHTEFKDTEVGNIPASWNIVSLDQIAKVSGGKRLPKGESLTEFDTGHPYIRVSDMNDNGIDLRKVKYVPSELVEVIKRYTVEAGDLYISVAGTIGLVGKVPKELNGANLTENADRISQIKCDIDYLMFFLKSEIIQKEINRYKTTNAQPKLALEKIKRFNIILPPKEEQIEINKVLKGLEQKFDLERNKMRLLLKIKSGLMQTLLTGKVRVNVDQPEVLI